MNTKQQWLEIAAADEYDIEQELLIWAELDEDWDNSHLADHIDFMRDIVGMAKHIEVEERDLAADEPGDAGSWYVVTTDNAAALRKDLRRLVNAAKREYKSQADQTKATLKAQRDLIQKGPTGGRHLCTIDCWEGIDTSEYHYGLDSDGVLWLRTNDKWKQTERRCDGTILDGLRLARAEWGGGGHLGPGESIRAGDGISAQELEAVWGKQK
jgi:hypothetical protein